MERVDAVLLSASKKLQLRIFYVLVLFGIINQIKLYQINFDKPL
jgi:hypothetical protein